MWRLGEAELAAGKAWMYEWMVTFFPTKNLPFPCHHCTPKTLLFSLLLRWPDPLSSCLLLLFLNTRKVSSCETTRQHLFHRAVLILNFGMSEQWILWIQSVSLGQGIGSCLPISSKDTVNAKLSFRIASPWDPDAIQLYYVVFPLTVARLSDENEIRHWWHTLPPSEWLHASNL